MRNKPAGNLGATTLRARRRKGDPMQAYDALPGQLRRWLAEAALPWSPASARRVWTRARAKGMSVEVALQTLTQAEIQTLARDANATSPHINRST